MQPKLIRQEDKSSRHHKDGDYYLTEHRTAEGRLMLSEGRTKDESVQGILNMLRDEPFASRKRHKTAFNVIALCGRRQNPSPNFSNSLAR